MKVLTRTRAYPKEGRMSEQSMVERVARAIYEGRNGPGCTPWARLTKAHQEPYRSDARVAIEAMREPTEAMTAAALGVAHLIVPGGVEEADECGHIYAAMIAAALEAP